MLFIILVLILSIPAIQTRLGKYATNLLNEDYNTNITINKVGLQFNGDVELKDIYVADHRTNTLFSINELNTSILNFKKLFDNKLTFGDIDVIGLTFNLRTYKGETDTNLDIFVEKFEDDTPRDSTNLFLLSSSDVTISKSIFKIIDDNNVDPDVLTFNNLYINSTDFLILGPEVKARINSLAFQDSRGITITNLSTNFAYTLQDMTFDALKIRTEKSAVKGNLKFMYNREDMSFFKDRVKLKANFRDSNINLDDLNAFYNEFGKNQTVTFTTSLSGTLNDLLAKNLIAKISGQTLVNGTVNFKNLFNPEADDFFMDGTFNHLASTHDELKILLPNVLGNAIPSSLQRLGYFDISGDIEVTSKKVIVDIAVETDLGFMVNELELDKIDDIDNALYTGNIILDDFDIGTFVEDPNIGKISFNLDSEGKGFTKENVDALVKGTIYSLNYNNYEFSNIDVLGNVQNKIFNGKLETKDDHIHLDFDGLVNFSKEENNYDFTANVHYADLKTLNFVSRDSISEFKGLVSMKMKGTSLDDAYGNITFKNTLYKNQNDSYYFKDFAIASRFNNDIRYIDINSPDIIEGSLSGKFSVNDVPKLIENALGNLYTNYDPYEINDNQFIDFNFRIYNTIAEIFVPNLKLASNTFIRGHLESDAKAFKLTFKSPQIMLEDYFANAIEMQVDNSNPLFNTYVELDSLYSKYYNVSKFSLINATIKDTLFIKTEFTGGKKNKDNFNLNLYYTIDEDNKSVLGFKKSEVKFKENQWYINQDKNNYNKLVFDRQFKNIDIDQLLMSHKEEQIKLSAQISKLDKNINLDFKDVNLIKITPEIDSLLLTGNLNGKLNILQREGTYLPQSNITIDNFSVNKFNLGSFKAEVTGNESLTNYSIHASLKDDNNQSLLVKGNIDVSEKDSNINLDVNFNKFILNPLNPFGEGNITNIRGDVTGNAKVTGRLQRSQINGSLLLSNGGLSIPYLNVDYSIQDKSVVNLSEQSFVFNNTVLRDTKYFSEANLSGRVNHINFSNWSLNLDINSNRLLVLDTEDSEDALYYGTAFVNGNIKTRGPTDQLLIKANVATERGTIFKIPLNDTETFGDNSYIHFLSPEEKESKLKGENLVLDDITGLELDFDLDVNDNAEIEIVIDRDSGSTIRGRGDGLLNVQINTNDKFNMYGDFIINQGVYNFVYGGLIQKEFTVKQGGTLLWEGNPLQAEINIQAIYSGIRANPSVLLDNPINRSIPVEVEIHLTGQLEQPNPSFDLRFPNVNSTLNSELQYRLNDKESKEFQALSLLATGSFKNRLRFTSQDFYGTLAERASAMINSILSDGDSKIQFGLDFDIGENTPDYETDDRLGVTLSTQLSDNILINGKVGVPIGGVNETVVAGDFEVEMLLNDDRTLSLKFFNRENSIRYFGEQIGYTQGVGLSYNVEFDTLKELIKKIFKRKQEKARKEKEDKEESKTEDLPEYIGFKKGK